MNLKRIFGLLLIGFLLFTSCSDDDVVETNTIVDIAIADSQFSTLVAALERTNLVTTLQSAGPFTVFAPTNAAFNSLGVDLNTLSDQELSDILLYHVLGGAAVLSTDLIEGQTYASTASASGPNGSALSALIERSGSSVTLNGSVNVTTADVIADNGVIHVVDQVLLPLDVVGHASANGSFTSLVGALAAAPGDLVSVLSGTGPFTVFAPTNSAFDDIASTVASLDPEQLATVLTYHVIGGANVRSSDLTDNAEVTTVSGQIVTVSLDEGAQLIDQTNTASDIVLTDVQATNGVIHVLTRVIIPNL